MTRLEKILTWIAWHLPRVVIYWAGVRLWTYASWGKWRNECPTSITISTALDRWKQSNEGNPSTDSSLSPIEVKSEEKSLGIVERLNLLRQNEGSMVSILGDTEHGTGVEVIDEWTHWKPLRFTGPNLLEALRIASDEYMRANPHTFGNAHLGKETFEYSPPDNPESFSKA